MWIVLTASSLASILAAGASTSPGGPDCLGFPQRSVSSFAVPPGSAAGPGIWLEAGSSAEEYPEVTLETPSSTVRCEATVTYLHPCFLAAPAGPAILRSRGTGGLKVDVMVASAPQVVVLHHRSRAATFAWAGAALVSAGVIVAGTQPNQYVTQPDPRTGIPRTDLNGTGTALVVTGSILGAAALSLGVVDLIFPHNWASSPRVLAAGERPRLAGIYLAGRDGGGTRAGLVFRF